MSLRERLGHATAGFGQNLVYNFMALFLLVYLYEDLGLSSRGIALLTVVLTIVRIWDAVNDILIGLLVDRTRTRWGTFRPYPLVTAIPIAVLTTLLFAIPEHEDVLMLVGLGHPAPGARRTRSPRRAPAEVLRFH